MMGENGREKYLLKMKVIVILSAHALSKYELLAIVNIVIVIRVIAFTGKRKVCLFIK